MISWIIDFTARIEEEFDEVAAGKMKWNKMIDDFYIPFKKDVEKTIETAERIKGERELGIDPKVAKKLLQEWDVMVRWYRLVMLVMKKNHVLPN